MASTLNPLVSAGLEPPNRNLRPILLKDSLPDCPSVNLLSKESRRFWKESIDLQKMLREVREEIWNLERNSENVQKQDGLAAAEALRAKEKPPEAKYPQHLIEIEAKKQEAEGFEQALRLSRDDLKASLQAEADHLTEKANAQVVAARKKAAEKVEALQAELESVNDAFAMKAFAENVAHSFSHPGKLIGISGISVLKKPNGNPYRTDEVLSALLTAMRPVDTGEDSRTRGYLDEKFAEKGVKK